MLTSKTQKGNIKQNKLNMKTRNKCTITTYQGNKVKHVANQESQVVGVITRVLFISVQRYNPNIHCELRRYTISKIKDDIVRRDTSKSFVIMYSGS